MNILVTAAIIVGLSVGAIATPAAIGIARGKPVLLLVTFIAAIVGGFIAFELGFLVSFVGATLAVGIALAVVAVAKPRNR
jgi:hypothetical protein